jgi:regulatory protein
MPEVTSIKPQKNGKRVNIYLDNKFGFGIDLENFVVLGIKEGNSYSQNEIEVLIKKAQFQKTLDRLLRFSTLRPRSEKEIRDWFRRKEVHESLYEELLNRLTRLELLDDYKFAKWWIDQRMTFKPRGMKALKYELLNKGIDRKVIDKVIEETGIDDSKTVKKILERNDYKWEKYKGLERKRKQTEFLLRKGYGWDIINKAL